MKTIFASLVLLVVSSLSSIAQEISIAQRWNECFLTINRNGTKESGTFVRRIHYSNIVMHDAWAAFEPNESTIMLGQNFNGFVTDYSGLPNIEYSIENQEKAISHAMRYFLSYFLFNTLQISTVTPAVPIVNLMNNLGYDMNNVSIDYSDGDPAKLGNYIGHQMWQYALADGLPEYPPVWDDPNQYPPYLLLSDPGTHLNDPYNWVQVVSEEVMLDANALPVVPSYSFAHKTFGELKPYALTEDFADDFVLYDNDFRVYLLQPAPPYFDTLVTEPVQWNQDMNRWGNLLAMSWTRFLEEDNVEMDISPATQGNYQPDLWPTDIENLQLAYDLEEGFLGNIGHSLNPISGVAYSPNVVNRSDYYKAIIRYWLGLRQSSGFIGNWFELINQLSSSENFSPTLFGSNEVLSDLEWDIKSYVALSGSLLDASIATFSNQGYYRFNEPVTFLRYMAEKGQSSNPELPNFHPEGIPLIDGLIELVTEGDPLAGPSLQNVGKVKIYAHSSSELYQGNPLGTVSWVLAENSWPACSDRYIARLTPSYVSAYSSLAQAAAKTLESIFNSPFFPSGLGEKLIPSTSFQFGEITPAQPVNLQWATFEDAAAQSGLSAVYAGVAHPISDIIGRKLGEESAAISIAHSVTLLQSVPVTVVSVELSEDSITYSEVGSTFSVSVEFSVEMDINEAPQLQWINFLPSVLSNINGEWLDNSTYRFNFQVNDTEQLLENVSFMISGARSAAGPFAIPYQSVLPFIDTVLPRVNNVSVSHTLINDAVVNEASGFIITVDFDKEMNTLTIPSIEINGNNVEGTFIFSSASGSWTSNTQWVGQWSLADVGIESTAFLSVTSGLDILGNPLVEYQYPASIQVDTKNPTAELTFTLQVGFASNTSVWVSFDEGMNTNIPLQTAIQPAAVGDFLLDDVSNWTTSTSNTIDLIWQINPPVAEINEEADIIITEGKDLAGNLMEEANFLDAFLAYYINNIKELNFISMEVFPNPASVNSDVKILCPNCASPSIICVYDASGKLIQKETTSFSNDFYPLNIPVEGLYFIQINSGQEVISAKIIIQGN